MHPIVCAIIGVAALAVGIVVGILIGIAMRKRFAEAKIGSAEAEARRVLEESTKQAETRKKEALLEAKEDILRQRNEAERELKRNRKDAFPGIIPRSYELHRRTASGEDLTLAHGVYEYSLREDGSILYSNGAALLCLAPDGTRTKLADARRVTKIL